MIIDKNYVFFLFLVFIKYHLFFRAWARVIHYGGGEKLRLKKIYWFFSDSWFYARELWESGYHRFFM